MDKIPREILTKILFNINNLSDIVYIELVSKKFRDTIRKFKFEKYLKHQQCDDKFCFGMYKYFTRFRSNVELDFEIKCKNLEYIFDLEKYEDNARQSLYKLNELNELYKNSKKDNKDRQLLEEIETIYLKMKEDLRDTYKMLKIF